jgi:hypothetical protein
VAAPADWRWQWVFPQENRWKNSNRLVSTVLQRGFGSGW